MNRRKVAFEKGLKTLRGAVMRRRGTIGAIGPRLYNAGGMVELNQIVRGDCIELLNQGQPGWVDLCFADPPFNIGYLYHGYDDQKDVEEYLEFSERWIRAVHHALKP